MNKYDSSREKNSVLPSIFITMAIAIIGFIIFCLTFHHVENHGVFAKETLSFRDTFIDDKFVKNEIERYNSASGHEKTLIENEYIHKKLIEIGRIKVTNFENPNY